MRKDLLRIEEVLPVEDGLFTTMATFTDFPLWNEAAGALMDEHYILDRSGMKYITRGLYKRLTDGELTSEALAKLAQMIYNKYKVNWGRYLGYNNAEYNPIDNYNMEQVETPNITKTTNTKVNTNLTVTSDGNTNTDVTTEDQTYGYNSSSPVNKDKSRVTGDKNNNTNHNTTQTEGDWDDNKTNQVEEEHGTRSLTRSGNIGVTTTAQMLQGDSDFWSNWDFIDAVFKDVDSVLALPIY